MRAARLRSALFVALLSFASFAVGAAGCGTANRFDGQVYRDNGVGYQVPPVPSEWRRIDVPEANLAFRDDAHDASILVNGRCGHRDDDTPLPALTQHLIIGTTDRDIVDQKVVPFDNREALRTVMRAKLDGVLMQYDIFVLKKDGCIYDFVYVSAPDKFEAGASTFERFVSGFHTLPGSGGK